MPNSQAPAHWSKDFVEHLRTVHFTLIALCIGLIVLASFPSKSEIQIAHDQALEILEVTKTWNSHLIEAKATEVIKEAIKSDDHSDFVVTGDNTVATKFDIKLQDKNNARLRPNFKLTSEMLKLDIPVELHSDVQGYDSFFPLLLNAPSSVRSFQRLWDALMVKGHIDLPRMPNSCIAGRMDSRAVKVSSINCEIQPTDVVHAARPLGMNFSSTHTGLASVDRFFSKLTPNGDWDYELLCLPGPDEVFVVLPVKKFKQIEFDAQALLIQRSEKWREKDGRSFKDAFRELASVYEPFEDSTIGSAERILYAEAKRTGDAFEVTGLKIPADVAVRCGVLLVLGVQLYLLIHLREFGNRLDREAGYEVAWIGVYFSKLARAMLFVSLLLLPAGTVVLLTIRGLSMTEHKRIAWAALVASNAASLTLAYFIFKVLPQPASPKSASPDEPLKTEPSESDSPPEQMFE